MNTHRRGARGETMAVEYLLRRGYRIITQNFKSHRGEVDIVCEKDLYLVFVEVKSWNRFGFEELERSIDCRKRRRITQAARVFLGLYREYAEKLVRFDVVFVRPDGESTRHIEGAFDEECRE